MNKFSVAAVAVFAVAIAVVAVFATSDVSAIVVPVLAGLVGLVLPSPARRPTPPTPPTSGFAGVEVLGVVLVFALLLMAATLGAGCGTVSRTASTMVSWDIVTGKASPDRGCRAVVMVDGEVAFELLENPRVNCDVSDLR